MSDQIGLARPEVRLARIDPPRPLALRREAPPRCGRPPPPPRRSAIHPWFRSSQRRETVASRPRAAAPSPRPAGGATARPKATASPTRAARTPAPRTRRRRSPAMSSRPQEPRTSRHPAGRSRSARASQRTIIAPNPQTLSTRTITERPPAPVRVKERDADDEETGERRVFFRTAYVFDTLSRARGGLSTGAVGRLEALEDGDQTAAV
jgi:hypothetical protein